MGNEIRIQAVRSPSVENNWTMVIIDWSRNA